METKQLELFDVWKNPTDTKNVWIFADNKDKEIARLINHKVCNVFQIRTPGIVSWRGSLDNDDYFIIIALDGIINAVCGEHEMMLPYDISPIAYLDKIHNMHQMPGGNEKLMVLMDLRSQFLPKFTDNLSFEEVMKLFRWTFESDTVTIDESIS